MGLSKLAVLAAVAGVLVACGGSGTDVSASNPASYDYVVPQLNFQRNYSRTITDNSNNTIDDTYTDTVTAVNPDGSYLLSQQDTTNGSIIVNGTDYAVNDESITYSNAGQETAYTYAEADGTMQTCTYDPHAAGPDFPLEVGGSWTLNYTLTCGTTVISYTQTGSIVDLEQVTVPAGTFTALKLQSTLTWTNVHGTSITETVTNWRDTTTLRSVKQLISEAYGGTLPTNGYAVSADIELQSQN
jgi:hypothetical protein